MAKKSIFCIAQTEKQAIEIIQQLKVEGFQHDDISVLFPDKQGTRDFAHKHETKAPEGAVTGAGTGGVVGGALGWLAGIGALAIPGVGPFIAAGPIMAALSGAAVGATVGGITGALVGMGIPEFEAKRYEGKIRNGNILISVHSENNRNAEKARTIFEKAGAQDIASSSEAPAKGSKKAVAAERSEQPSRIGKRSVTPATSTSKTSTTSPAATTKSNRAVPPVVPPPIIAEATPSKQPAAYVPTQEEIAARARQIFLSKGSQPGRDVENWLEAEAQLKAEWSSKMRKTKSR